MDITLVSLLVWYERKPAKNKQTETVSRNSATSKQLKNRGKVKAEGMKKRNVKWRRREMSV